MELKLSKTQEKELARALRKGLSTQEVAKATGVDEISVCNFREERYLSKKVKREYDLNEIVLGKYDMGLSFDEIAKETKISVERARKIINEMVPKKIPFQRQNETVEMIIDLRRIGKGLKVIAERTDSQLEVVQSVLRRNNIESPNKMTERKIELAVFAHEKEMSLTKSAAYSGISVNTLKKIWKESGIVIPEFEAPKKLPPYKKKFILMLHDSFTFEEIAQLLHISRNTAAVYSLKKGLRKVKPMSPKIMRV